MRPRYLRITSLIFFCTGVFTSAAYAIQSRDEAIVIPPIDIATIDSQESDSIDFVLPGGKGAAVVRDWLAKFREDGWTISLVDQDSMSAEYELTKDGWTLEIQLDDVGFDEADISISCDSGFRLAIEGAPPIPEPVGPTISPAVIVAPVQANARPGEISLGSVADLKWEIEEGWKPDWWISPNGRRFACRRWTESGATISVDGAEMGTWSTIVSEVIFSPDSQHHAFVADRDENGTLWYYLVVDGVPGKPYLKLDDEIAFTADSAQIIFGQEHDDGMVVLIRPVDPGKEVIEPGYRFATYQNHFFRGPGQGLGYIAAFSDREDAFFWNGKQIGERFADIDPGHIAVSGDGHHVAFFAEISPVRLGLVLDGMVVREHNQFDQGRILENSLTLSPNGKRMAWGSRLNDQEFFYVDGKPGAGYEKVDFPVFSRDASRFSHVATKGESPLVVIDGVESEPYAMASQPEFSDDGKMVAYYVELNKKELMVVNGNRQAEYDMVTTPVVSRDGSVVAYATVHGDKGSMIINGTVKATYSTVGSPHLIPNSNRLAWIAFDEGKGWRLFVDGVEKFSFQDFAGYPAFSPDGEHIAIVTVGEKGESVMVDGQAGEAFDRIVSHESQRARFDESGNCYYLAVRDDELFLVETRIANWP
jgi:hypothetical protein